uniref:AlNc14C356G10956 protein n=1 Tax=Albugo laibachii Nc14 TaxID=890382 RepID=F0WXK5_9STRA|nr:AlNc14C356G10956 [Albugo laibachii Nc14]|eukprot:CCA26199.1 AlNc14C356G10956 [Albugo laibachii Nc14]
MAEDENADNNEDNDDIAASEDDETFCMLAELEQGSSMEDKHREGFCLTSSGLDDTPYALNCPIGTEVATGLSCVTNGHRLEDEACHPP